mmetsp:Transcript_9388/g.15827  ORF Transcript_9388/g.15827 Transcript_9388/m.15827 type:complete len:111 (-) Transcript_9388:149-481(-)
MFSRQLHFQKLDLDSLFYAFYFQQSRYQQYLAAVELKLRGWEFNYRFNTWVKRETVVDQSQNGKRKEKQKTLYFDYEHNWSILTSDDPNKFANCIERELMPQAAPPNPAI